jgi:hypothetical protein
MARTNYIRCGRRSKVNNKSIVIILTIAEHKKALLRSGWNAVIYNETFTDR